jgi:hypothetical protein
VRADHKVIKPDGGRCGLDGDDELMRAMIKDRGLKSIDQSADQSLV